MRSLLTGGIKAILAVAALSTAIHWVLRIQREPEGLVTAAYASLPDPETTGSIAPRQAAPPAIEARQAASAPAPAPKAAEAVRAAPAGLDQSHLAALIANAGATTKAKVAKVAKR